MKLCTFTSFRFLSCLQLLILNTMGLHVHVGNLPPKKKVRLRDMVDVPEECVMTPGSKRLYQVSCDELAIGTENVTLSERQIQCLIQTLVKAHNTIYPNFKKYFEKEHQQYLGEKFLVSTVYALL